jgi:hypothetical protein
MIQERTAKRDRRMNKYLLWIALLGLTLGIFALSWTSSNAWTPPIPIQKMASLFRKSDTENIIDRSHSIDGRIPVGYWHETEKGSSALDAVDKDWDPEERSVVIRYLSLISNESSTVKDGPKVLASWRGLHFCSICDEATGNSDHGDDKYNWPQGFLHYIEKHDVKPPQKFIDHVREKMK